MPSNRAVPMERMNPSIYLDFEKKKAPSGFDNLNVDDEVVIVLKGKVKMLRKDEDGSGMRIDYTRLELASDVKPKTMTDVLKELQGS